MDRRWSNPNPEENGIFNDYLKIPNILQPNEYQENPQNLQNCFFVPRIYTASKNFEIDLLRLRWIYTKKHI